jgi:energy-coupling factor transport system permease protein
MAAAVAAVSRLRPYWIWQGVTPFRYILILTAGIQMLFYPEPLALFSLGPIRIGWLSLNAAALLATRLILILAVAQMLLISTSTLQMTVALEYLFRPLKRLRFPIDELVMIITVAMHFLPLLWQETLAVKAAQTARGADFSTGSPLSRWRKQMMIIVPVFSLALQKVNDLSCSLESRAYVPGAGRTHLNPLGYARRDFAVLGVLVALGAVLWRFPL